MRVAVPAGLRDRIDGAVGYDAPADAVLIHKGLLGSVPLETLAKTSPLVPEFQNDVFLLFRLDGRSKVSRARPLTWLSRFLTRQRVSPLETYLDDVASARFAGSQRVFIHIPKTAGTSVFEAARQAAIRPLYLDDLTALQTAVPHLAAYDLIGGHVGFDALEAEIADAQYFAIVREPLERLVSVAGHARRPGERIESFSPVMRFLAENSLRAFLDRMEGRIELRVQQWMLTGKMQPSQALTRERLERIAVATTEGLDRFLHRQGASLGIDPARLPRLNVTRDRQSLVSQAEIDEAVAAHGDMIEAARDLYRLVREQELDREA
ncbi:hypothetical protein [Jiella mangrovi]|uniref:Sulfotransferase family protein n=1 Tax=Jiella mangrovi TaxID=2821407 RepID=A0ABS4BIL2_9HYPH|nr:hypothetical protein [Jiella mangrovi]MBP0616603.1 hypothetical protein [Jiella mangrovi]